MKNMTATFFLTPVRPCLRLVAVYGLRVADTIPVPPPRLLDVSIQQP